MIKGIDVSYSQGIVDWNKVKAAGVQFAMLRGGFGKNSNQIDAQFERNYAAAKSAGIPIGVYHYSYATDIDRAKAEAEFCISYLQGKSFEYPVAYDIEDNTQANLDKQTLTDIAKTFLSTVKSAGYNVMLYANKNWLTNKFDMSQLAEYDVWIAQYNKDVTYSGAYKMWQYSSSEHIDGISGNVDADYDYGVTTQEKSQGDFKMKTYKNGSTRENVYKTVSDCNGKQLVTRIGSLDPWETCECYGIVEGCYLIVYNAGNTKKTGFVKYSGGING